MYDKTLLVERFQQIEEQLDTLIKATEKIVDLNYLLTYPEGILQINGICMCLLVVGEELKKIDQITDKQLLNFYPNIPWNDVIGMRNKIAHHYFDIDADIVFDILRFDIPPLLETIHQIITDIKLK
jgi:uncharacterized protein with HEPN domain